MIKEIQIDSGNNQIEKKNFFKILPLISYFQKQQHNTIEKKGSGSSDFLTYQITNIFNNSVTIVTMLIHKNCYELLRTRLKWMFPWRTSPVGMTKRHEKMLMIVET